MSKTANRTNAALKSLWAKACDAWVLDYQNNNGVIYLKPLTNRDEDDVNEDGQKKKFPRWIRDGQVFCLTAHNPFGRRRSKDENCLANERLKAALIVESKNGRDFKMWDSFGFSVDSSDEWREDGFAVAFVDRVSDEDEQFIVDLAKEYLQGAVYRYRWSRGGYALERKTVKALLEDVEEVVYVEISEKPVGIKNADV